MNLTDKQAIKIYKRLKMSELVESIDSYPENERDGRSDMQFLADEISYFRSCYEEEGHAFKDDLEDAISLLTETKNGKIVKINPKTLKPMRGYWPSDIEVAKSIYAEYRQLVYYCARLKDLGYCGKW